MLNRAVSGKIDTSTSNAFATICINPKGVYLLSMLLVHEIFMKRISALQCILAYCVVFDAEIS